MESLSGQPYNEVLVNGISESERNWAVLIHFSLYSIIFLNIFAVIIPGALWFLKKAESRFIDEHGKAALNFFLTLTILSLVFGLGIFFLMAAVGIAIPALATFDVFNALSFGFGGFLFLFGVIAFVMLVSVMILILPLFGVKAASAGKTYKYPISFPFLS